MQPTHIRPSDIRNFLKVCLSKAVVCLLFGATNHARKIYASRVLGTFRQ